MMQYPGALTALEHQLTACRIHPAGVQLGTPCYRPRVTQCLRDATAPQAALRALQQGCGESTVLIPRQHTSTQCLYKSSTAPFGQECQARTPQQRWRCGAPSPATAADSQQCCCTNITSSSSSSSRSKGSCHTQQLLMQPHPGNWHAGAAWLCQVVSSEKQSKPETPAAAGAPPESSAGASAPESSTINNGTTNTSSSKSRSGGRGNYSGSGSSSSSSSSSGNDSGPPSVADDAEAAVDRFLEKRWNEIKQEIKRELPPEQASMVDSWSPDDLNTDKVFREMAQHQLGPFLQVMGIEDDPYDFFLDLFRYALAFQLAGAGIVFYTVELGLGGDAGDALRAVAGLCLGYFLRLGIKIEQLAWPIYNALVQWLIQDNAVYDYPAASPQEKQDTLNKLAVAVAAGFLVPKVALGWHNDECWQFVVPMVVGLVYFDAAYLFGLLAKLSLGGRGGDNDD